MTDDGRLDARDDADLLRAARHDASAFRVVYDRHAPRLYAFLLRRTNDRGAAFELTSETFSQAWLSRERFTDQGHGAAPWLFGIARNVLASSVRSGTIARDARRRVGLEWAEHVAAPSRAWLDEPDELDEKLQSALESLPDAQRRAVQMRVLDGSAYDEIATELDITPGAARVRVHRGLEGIRRLIRPDRPKPIPVLPSTSARTAPSTDKPGDLR